MLDFTKKTQLPESLKTKYNISRVILYLFFVLAILFVSYAILFPIVPLDYFFNSPTSSKNTMSASYFGKSKDTPIDGKVSKNDQLLLSANPLGQFSKANFVFILDNKKSDIANTSIQIKKSYQAFRYPNGEPLGFKNGTLLTTSNGSYYIVSNNELRKFSNTNIILELGYPKSSFINISEDDLIYNKIGTEIIDATSYPDNTIFIINDVFYQLKNGQFSPYISTQAFLTQFDASIAIAKDESFLSKYPTSETQLGFSDGTLASSDISVYIFSENKSYPIMNPETFIAMGFNWNDVIPVTQDELNMHEKQKQFTYRQPHPNGTLFVDKKNNKYYIIENGFKRPILSDAIAKTFSKQKPVEVDIDGAEISNSCILKKQSFNAKAFKCSTSLENLTGLVGGDYQIATTFSDKANLDTAKATFSTPFNWQNMKISLGSIKNKILTKWQR